MPNVNLTKKQLKELIRGRIVIVRTAVGPMKFSHAALMKAFAEFDANERLPISYYLHGGAGIVITDSIKAG